MLAVILGIYLVGVFAGAMFAIMKGYDMEDTLLNVVLWPFLLVGLLLRLFFWELPKRFLGIFGKGK